MSEILNEPMRSLQIVDTLGMGGAETWLMEVLRRWSRSGEGQMDFLLTSGNRGVFDEEAVSLGARLHYVRYGRRTLPRFTKEFRCILKEGNYEAVHDHQDYASGWHFLLGGRRLPPVRVTHVHNPCYQIRNNYGISPMRRFNLRIGRSLVRRHATHIAGTSRQLIGEYGFDDGSFSHIPKAALHCGFDPARFAGDAVAIGASVRGEFGWAPDSRIVLFAGRIDHSADFDHSQNHKNSAFAVAIGIEAARRDQRLCMVLAGQPSPATPILEARIAEARLSERIRFLGIRKDIARLMLGTDLLLFPSRGEGLGMVAVEAQASGLPVVMSTSVPSESVVIPELVTRMDLTKGVAACAERVLGQLDLPRDVRAANEAICRSPFSLEHSASALLRLYREGVLP